MPPFLRARITPARAGSLFALSCCALAACGGTTVGTAPPVDDGGGDETTVDASPIDTSAPDAGADTSIVDAPAVDVGPLDAQPDGAIPPPRRLACVPVSALGKAIPVNGYGALEGELVHVEPAGSKNCDANDSHVVIQVQANGATYEVAIDIGSTGAMGSAVGYATKDVPATLPPQGWTTVAYDYVSNLGLHSTDMPLNTMAQNSTFVVNALQNVSYLTIHGRGYTDGTGAHDVHRNGGDRDGVLILHGQGAGGADKAIAFRFDTDTF